MLASPKMNEYLGVIAPPGEKALYMGYANIPLAVGWGYGSLMGGKVYDQMGDKANLAIRYMQDHLNISGEIARNEAFTKLMEATGKNAVDATNLLWSTYHPYELWYQFAAIGIVSAIGIFIYSMVVKKSEGSI